MTETVTTTEKRESETRASGDVVQTQETVETAIEQPASALPSAPSSEPDDRDEFDAALVHLIGGLHESLTSIEDRLIGLEQRIVTREEKPGDKQLKETAGGAQPTSPLQSSLPAGESSISPEAKPDSPPTETPAGETIVKPTPEIASKREKRRAAGWFF